MSVAYSHSVRFHRTGLLSGFARVPGCPDGRAAERRGRSISGSSIGTRSRASGALCLGSSVRGAGGGSTDAGDRRAACGAAGRKGVLQSAIRDTR